MNLLGDPEYQKIRCYQQLVHILGLAAALRLAFDLGDRLVDGPHRLVRRVVLEAKEQMLYLVQGNSYLGPFVRVIDHRGTDLNKVIFTHFVRGSITVHLTSHFPGFNVFK